MLVLTQRDLKNIFRWYFQMYLVEMTFWNLYHSFNKLQRTEGFIWYQIIAAHGNVRTRFLIALPINTLQWRHHELDGITNHQPHDCLLNCLFRRWSKKTSKLRVTGLCEWNSPMTGEFPAYTASNAENASIWWRHHCLSICKLDISMNWASIHYAVRRPITIWMLKLSYRFDIPAFLVILVSYTL